MLSDKHYCNTIDTLILSGGSLFGILYLSVYKFLIDNNLFNDITNFYGVSIGSLACLIGLLGYTYEEMIECFLMRINITDIIKIDLTNIFKIIKEFGINDGSELENLIKSILEFKGLSPYITMKELYEYTGKNYYIGVSSLINSKYELFDHNNNPDLPVWLAVRMSCSIPILFTPIKYNNDYYVDGGVINNMPIDFIIDKCLSEEGKCIIADDTDDDIVDTDEDNEIEIKEETQEPKRYKYNFICVKLENHNKKKIDDNITFMEYIKMIFGQIFTNQKYKQTEYKPYIINLHCAEFSELIHNTKLLKEIKKNRILKAIEKIYDEFEIEFIDKIVLSVNS